MERIRQVICAPGRPIHINSLSGVIREYVLAAAQKGLPLGQPVLAAPEDLSQPDPAPPLLLAVL